VFLTKGLPEVTDESLVYRTVVATEDGGAIAFPMGGTYLLLYVEAHAPLLGRDDF